MFFLKSTWMTILAVILMLAFTWCLEDITLHLHSLAQPMLQDEALPSLVGNGHV